VSHVASAPRGPCSSIAIRRRTAYSHRHSTAREPAAVTSEQRRDRPFKAVDAKAGLVTISIGSDADLQKGQTLEVFRLVPEPVYLGKLEVIDLNPTQAVGKPEARSKATIQVGDRVSVMRMVNRHSRMTNDPATKKSPESAVRRAPRSRFSPRVMAALAGAPRAGSSGLPAT